MNQLSNGSRQLLIIRIIIFLLYAGYGAWMPFFYVYLEEVLHFGGVQIGSIAAFQQINIIWVLPIWGMIADRFGRRKVFLMVLVVVVLFLIPAKGFTTFPALSLFILIFSIFYSSLSSLADSMILDFIETHPEVRYGQVRLMGSMGWSVASMVVGMFIRKIGIDHIFVLASGTLLLVFIITITIYKPLKVTRNIQSLKFNLIVKNVLNNRKLNMFLIIILLFGIFTTPYQLFINLYFKEIGGTLKQIGVAYMVQGLFELPFFFFGFFIVKKFGAKNVLLFTIVTAALRMYLYYVFTNPSMAILLGAFHGINLALFLVAVVEYVHQFIASEWRATGQSMIYASYFGVGTCIGNFFTGYLIQYDSMKFAMIVQAGLTLLLFVVSIFLLQSKRQSS